MTNLLTEQEITDLIDKYAVSRGRVLIWEKEGRNLCAECGEPVLVSPFERPTHLQFNVGGHHAQRGEPAPPPALRRQS